MRVLRAFVVRVACYGLALRIQLFAEARPAPTLPDAVLAWVPYVAWVDRYNYLLWLLAYVPLGLAFWWKDVERFYHFAAQDASDLAKDKATIRIVEDFYSKTKIVTI